MPANARTLPNSRSPYPPAAARKTCPAVITTSMSSALISKPNRRTIAGVSMPEIAKHRGGNIPMTPRRVASNGMLPPISATIGEMAATAVRKLNATSRMPSNASTLPRHHGTISRRLLFNLGR